MQPTAEQVTAWVEANFEPKLRKGGRELVINNPFDGDTGRNFNINVEKASCHDWRGDGWAGSYKPTFLRFVQVYRSCSFAQAIKEVCGKQASLSGLAQQFKRQKQQQSQEEREREAVSVALPEGSQKLLESNHQNMAQVLINWLGDRGVTAEDIKSYNLHHQSGNVVWPYYEYDALVYWQSRNRLNKVFMFPPEDVGVTKGMFLYGFDMIEPSDYIAITEAIFGVMTLKEQTLASGGAVLTPKQVQKMRILNPKRGVILGPDNDGAGVKSIASNYHLIKPYFPVLYSIPPRIMYEKDDEVKYTKDWNEIGELIGFPKVRPIFEKRVKHVSFTEVVRFSAGLLPEGDKPSRLEEYL